MANEAGLTVPATAVYNGRREFKAGDTATMALDVRVGDKAWPAGSRLWLCVDIRQGCGSLQTEDPAGSGYVSAAVVSSGARLAGRQPGPAGLPCRSMDWLPEMPEFVQLVELETAGELAPGETIRIEIGGSAGFELPDNSIEAFHLWVLADAGEGVSVHPDLGKGYFRANYGVVPVYWLDRQGEFALPPRPLPTSPSIRVVGGPPDRLLLVAPTVVRQGQPLVLRAGLVDGRWNPAAGLCRPGPVTVLRDGSVVATHPVEWQTREEAPFSARAEMPGISEPGVYTLRAGDSAAADAASNAVSVVPESPAFMPYWGDLHTMLFDRAPSPTTLATPATSC